MIFNVAYVNTHKDNNHNYSLAGHVEIRSNDNKYVTITIGNEIVSVLADDMIRAVNNCKNIGDKDEDSCLG